MRQRHGVKNIYWFTLLLVFGLVAACTEPLPDETRLRQAIAEMEKAAEAKQAGPILGYVAGDFLGNKAYHKADIRAMLLLNFHQNQHIHVYLRVVELTIRAGRAQLTCQVILAGRGEKVVPERGRVLEIKSDWEKRDGEWQLIRARWKDPLTQP